MTNRREKLWVYHEFLSRHILFYKEPGQRPCYCGSQVYSGVPTFVQAPHSVPDLDDATIDEVLKQLDAPPALQYSDPRRSIIHLIANTGADVDHVDPTQSDCLLEFHLAKIMLRVHHFNSAERAAQAAARVARAAGASLIPAPARVSVPAGAVRAASGGKGKARASAPVDAADDAARMPPPQAKRFPRMQCFYRGSGKRVSRGRGGSVDTRGSRDGSPPRGDSRSSSVGSRGSRGSRGSAAGSRGSAAGSRGSRGSAAGSRGSRGSAAGSGGSGGSRGVNWRGGSRGGSSAAGVRGLAEPLNLSAGAGKALRGPAPRAGAGIPSKTYGDCLSAVIDSIHVDTIKDQAGIDQLLASACDNFDEFFSKTDNIVRDVHYRVKEVKAAWEQFVAADLAFGVEEAKFLSAKEAGDSDLSNQIAVELDRVGQARAHAARELRAAKVHTRDLIQMALCYELPEVLESAQSVFKLDEGTPARRRRIEAGGSSGGGSGGSRASSSGSKRRYESGDGGCGN